MSTVVYYSNHNMPVEDVHSKHILPSLAQIMPPVNQQQAQQQQQQQNYHNDLGTAAAVAAAASLANNSNSIQAGQISPNLVGNNLMPMMFGDQKVMYLQQPQQGSPEVFSQTSQSSTANTTPASSFSGASANYVNNPHLHHVHGHGQSSNPNGNLSESDKCICKSNTNRIPRPRNAFILFRQKYHQSVLDEGNVIRTNPEVSRELGRRWRALTSEEKDHWNNLAEEEKKNHAKKYPGYRYTPRRNGKNKNCNFCRQKALRQQQQQAAAVQQQQQQQQVQAQQVQAQQYAAAQLQQEQYQQYLQLQQQGQSPVQAIPQQQPGQANFLTGGSNHSQQFLISSNPFQNNNNAMIAPAAPQNYQFSFNNTNASTNNNSNPTSTDLTHTTGAQEKLSPLSSVPGQLGQHYGLHPHQQPAGSGPTANNGSEFGGQFTIGSYDQQVPATNQQRYTSLPNPLNNNGSNTGGYSFDAYNSQQQ